MRGLKSYEEYAFWLRSCTLLGCVMSERAIQQTLEGKPSDQLQPLVHLLYPDDVSLVSIVFLYMLGQNKRQF